MEGTWHLVHAVEDSIDTLNIESSRMKLIIDDDRYKFESTLGKNEHGRIDVQSKSICFYPAEETHPPYKIDLIKKSRKSFIARMEQGRTSRVAQFQRAE